MWSFKWRSERCPWTASSSKKLQLSRFYPHPFLLIGIISIYFILCLQSLLLGCHPNQWACLNERQPLGVVSRYSGEPSASKKCESEKQDEGKDEGAGQIKRRQVQDYLGKGQRALNQGQARTKASSFISHKVLFYYICPRAKTGINALNYFSYYWKVLFNTLHLKTFPLSWTLYFKRTQWLI